MNKSSKNLEFVNKGIVSDLIVIDAAAAAKLLNIKKSRVYQLVNCNQLPYHRVDRRIYFFKSQLTDWIKQGQRSSISNSSNKIFGINSIKSLKK